MRVTTHMLNESARKAGMPVNHGSLWNYMKNDGKGNSMLDALSQKKNSQADSENKKKYEKLGKEAGKLNDSANALLQDGEKSLFTEAKEKGDTQKIQDAVKAFFESYNSNLVALKDTAGTMNDFYRYMLADVPKEMKDKFAEVGITFTKGGVANIDQEKLKAADETKLENLFGSKSEFMNQVKFIATRISNNAQECVKSFGNAYARNGNLYSGSYLNSRYDLRG